MIKVVKSFTINLFMLRALILCLSFPFLALAQSDSIATIKIKKSQSNIKSMTVLNYPGTGKGDVKNEIKTETTFYDKDGNLTIKYNYHNNKKEIYSYYKINKLTCIKVYDTYLNTYSFQDSFVYSENGLLQSKMRYIQSAQLKQKMSTAEIIDGKLATNFPLGGVYYTESYKYNSEEFLVLKEVTFPNSIEYNFYKYDSAGFLVLQRKKQKILNKKTGNESIYSDTLFLEQKKFSYDDSGNLIKIEATDSYGNTRTEINKYNSENKMAETSVFDKTKKVIEKYTFTYNKKGDLVEQKTYDYVHKSESLTKYTYEYYTD